MMIAAEEDASDYDDDEDEDDEDDEEDEEEGEEDPVVIGTYFSINRNHTEDQIVRGLIGLREVNLPTKICFTKICFEVRSIIWTKIISREMIRTFEYHKNLGSQWGAASFVDLEPETSVHAHLVLRSLVTTQLFQKFSFGNEDYMGRPMDRQLAASIAFILRNGRHWERLNIYDFEIGQDAMSDLAARLVTPRAGRSISAGLQKQELRFFRVTFPYDEESSERRTAPQCLADGLARNKTLTAFELERSNAIDFIAAMIVRSLIGHQSLKKLTLHDVEFGEETIDMICRLLASPTCFLLTLDLSNHIPATDGGAEFDFERFIEQLPLANTSLERMELCDFAQSIDHHSANQLLRSLWKLPSLKYLTLNSNLIRDPVHLAANLSRTTPHSCLRELLLYISGFGLGGQSTSDGHSTRAVLHLLNVFPELGYLGRCVAESVVQERLDLNRCSGMLLRGAEVPLSIWPVVLAKVNTDQRFQDHTSGTPSRKASIAKANVIYHMLQGPLLEGFGHLDQLGVGQTTRPESPANESVDHPPRRCRRRLD